MYVVAEIDEAICTSTSCSLCVQFCPEANTILWDAGKGKGLAVIVDARCKGCAVCEVVCNDMAKKHAIKMVSRTNLYPTDRPQNVPAIMKAQQERQQNGASAAVPQAAPANGAAAATTAPATAPASTPSAEPAPAAPTSTPAA